MTPQSMLIVCIGNTCRSPMVEALAKRRWPGCRIKSVGTHVLQEGAGAAEEAITVMNYYDIDISKHKTTKIESVDVSGYQFILALDKNVKRTLINQYGIDKAKIIDLFVADPFGGGGIEPYIKCRNEISKKLATI